MASYSPSTKVGDLTSKEIDERVKYYMDNELDYSSFDYLSESEVRALFTHFVTTEIAPDSTTADRQLGPPPGVPFSTNAAEKTRDSPDSSEQVTDTDHTYPWKEVKSVREVSEEKIGAGSSNDHSFVTQEAFRKAMNSAIEKRIQLCKLTKQAVQFSVKTREELTCKLNCHQGLMRAHTESQAQLWKQMVELIKNTLQVKLQAVEQMTSTMVNATPSESGKLIKIFAGENFTVRIYSSSADGDVNRMAVGSAGEGKCAFCNRCVTDHVFMPLDTVEEETNQD